MERIPRDGADGVSPNAIMLTGANELCDVARALAALARILPPRMSVRQALGLLTLASRFSAEVTLGDLGAWAGNGADGRPVLTPAILDSIRNFSDRGWVDCGSKSEDRRRLVLRLTEEGHALMSRIVTEVRGLSEVDSQSSYPQPMRPDGDCRKVAVLWARP